jgi:hypothetical protein
MINLATRPFRNDRLLALLFTLAAVATVAITVAHAVVAVRLAKGGARHEQVRRVEQEVAQLREEASRSRAAQPDAATLARWSLMKDLVDRRMFSWTRLFEQLETTLPWQVRLISLTPKVSRGDVSIGMTAAANPPGVGLELIDTLESRGPFAEVYPISTTQLDNGEASYVYELRYRQPALMVETATAGAKP